MTDTTSTPESCACIGHPDGPCDLCIEYQCGATAERDGWEARYVSIATEEARLVVIVHALEAERDAMREALRKAKAFLDDGIMYHDDGAYLLSVDLHDAAESAIDALLESNETT